MARDRGEGSGGDTEGKDEQFRMKRGARFERGGTGQPGLTPVISHRHYFVIMVVGASLRVLLITDKGLRDVEQTRA